MRLTNIALGFATAAAIFVAGCTANQTVSEESLGLRKTDLYSENTTVADKTMYKTTVAGQSTKIERAFENAPPMIPHSVDGMLPITINNNQCVACHMPEMAAAVGAVSVPKSHLADLRPKTTLAENGRIVKNGMEVTNTSDFVVAKPVPGTDLEGARFNCSQCHAPQSEGQLVANEFQADFRATTDNKSSNLIDNLNEGVK